MRDEEKEEEVPHFGKPANPRRDEINESMDQLFKTQSNLGSKPMGDRIIMNNSSLPNVKNSA